MLFNGISLDNKQTSIRHDKFTHLGQNCITLKILFDGFYDKTELSDVICENLSKNNGKSIRFRFEKYKLVINQPTQIIILLQRTEYSHKTSEYRKKKLNFYHNIPCHFQVAMMKWFIFWYQLRFFKVNMWIVVDTTMKYCITALLGIQWVFG